MVIAQSLIKSEKQISICSKNNHPDEFCRNLFWKNLPKSQESKKIFFYQFCKIFQSRCFLEHMWIAVYCLLYYTREVVYGLEVLAHFAPWGYFLGLGVLAHFGSKNQTRKIVKIHKDLTNLRI